MNPAAKWSLVAAGGYAALSFAANRSAFFPMPYPQGRWEQQSSLHAEDIWLTAQDGVKLHAWFVPVHNASVVTLFLHGNAGNITHRADTIREITAAGSSILMLDYRGYGKSQGRPTERGLYSDAEAAYQWLMAKGWRPQQLIVHGESLGTTIAVDLASRRECRSLILEAPFPSARAVAATVFPVVGPLLIWGFDAKTRIRLVQAPLLILHGSQDEVIPLRLGQELFDAANQPKSFWLVPGAGHNDIAASAGSAYRTRLAEFYRCT